MVRLLSIRYGGRTSHAPARSVVMMRTISRRIGCEPISKPGGEGEGEGEGEGGGEGEGEGKRKGGRRSSNAPLPFSSNAPLPFSSAV